MYFLIPLFLSLFLSYLIFVFIKRSGVFRKENDLLPFSFSYLILFGVIDIQLFLFKLFSIQWNIYSLIAPWVCLLFLLILFARKSFRFSLREEKFSHISKILLATILLLLLFVAFESVIRPVSSWDAWSDWLLKAKIFFIDKSIFPIFSYVRSDYPIGISLFVAFFYIILGRADDTSVLIVFFLFYFFLSITLYAFIRRYMNQVVSLLFTFFLLTTQNIIRHGGRYEAGLADLALGYGVLCCSVLLVMLVKSKDYKLFIFLQVAAAICGFIKYEGIVFSINVEFIALFLLYYDKKFKWLPWLFVWLLPTVGWEAYKILLHVPGHYIFSTNGIQLIRIPTIFFGMTKEFLNLKNWNLIWSVFFVSIYFYRKFFTKEIIILFVLFVMQWCSYFVVYLLTPVDYKAQLFITIDRLYLHLAPLAFVVVALLVGPRIVLKKKKAIPWMLMYLK